MFSTLVTVALFALPAITGVHADFAINNPVLTQCQNARITWQAMQPPYNLLIVKPTEPCGDPVIDAGDFTGTDNEWLVALPAGAQVVLSLADANGEEAWSSSLTVGPSDNATCVSDATRAALGLPAAASSSASSSTASSTKSTSVVPAASSPTTSSKSSTTSVPAAVGGVGNNGPLANSQNNSAAPSLHQLSVPFMSLAAIVAGVAISL